MKLVMLAINVVFGIYMLVTQTARWAWAKLRGKPYDSGMDMQ